METYELKQLIRKDGEVIGAEFQNGQKLMISQWDHSTLAEFENVSFRTPVKEGKFLQFVKAPLHLRADGTICQIPSYWRYGVKIEGQIITRTFRFSCDEGGKKINEIPFGADVVGRAKVCLSHNKKTGEKRIIVDYYIYSDQKVVAKNEVKIGGKTKPSTIWSSQIPKTESNIVVNKVEPRK